MKENWVIATNGHETTWNAILYAVSLAEKMNASLTLLGVVEKEDEKHPLQAMFSRAVTLFQEKGISYELQIAHGAMEEILGENDWENASFLFISPLGRPFARRLLVGRSFRAIMEKIPVPLFYVREAKLSTEKILVCLGGLGYASKAEDIALKIAKATEASLTFLHVVPPVEWEYPPARDIESHWKHLLETDTLPARTLRRALDSARQANIPARAKVRHGSVVDEILLEIQEGAYDLVCMGSPYSPHSLRHFYAPNVTAEVAEECRVPLLTARFAPKFLKKT
jgi:nucleotide-binding universal stress UspA family protein